MERECPCELGGPRKDLTDDDSDRTASRARARASRRQTVLRWQRLARSHHLRYENWIRRECLEKGGGPMEVDGLALEAACTCVSFHGLWT